jgi:hypothetical protein
MGPRQPLPRPPEEPWPAEGEGGANGNGVRRCRVYPSQRRMPAEVARRKRLLKVPTLTAGLFAASLFLAPVQASAAQIGIGAVPEAATAVQEIQYGYGGPRFGPRGYGHRGYGGPRFRGRGYGYGRGYGHGYGRGYGRGYGYGRRGGF